MKKFFMENIVPSKDAMCYSMMEAPVLQRPVVVKDYGKIGKIRFRAILQDFNKPNRNNRIYPTDVMSDALEEMRDVINDGGWPGELDHPFDDTNDERKATVTYQNTSHLIQDYEIKDDILYGELETVTFSKGPDLYKAIVYDKIRVGFSARCFGNVKNDGQYSKLVAPVLLICYDAVSLPSHKRARIQEVKVQEAMNILDKAYKGGEKTVFFENQLYVIDYFEKMIEESIKKYNKTVFSF